MRSMKKAKKKAKSRRTQTHNARRGSRESAMKTLNTLASELSVPAAPLLLRSATNGQVEKRVRLLEARLGSPEQLKQLRSAATSLMWEHRTQVSNREHIPRCRLAPIAADYQRLAWAIVERCGAPTYVDQRRLAPTGATVADQIGADWRRPIPTDADTAWQRPSTTMLEPSKQHTPPHPHAPFLFILLKLQTG